MISKYNVRWSFDGIIDENGFGIESSEKIDNKSVPGKWFSKSLHNSGKLYNIII